MFSIHFIEENFPVLKVIEFAGDANQPFLENGKYYFMNFQDFHIYDANTMERLFMYDYGFVADLWVTEKYNIATRQGWGEDLAVLDRTTDTVKIIELGTDIHEASITRVTQAFDGELGLFGI